MQSNITPRRPGALSHGRLAAGTLMALLGLAEGAQAGLAISSDPTANVKCARGTCTATAPNAVLNVTDLVTMLNASNLTVSTGKKAVFIEIDAAFSWASNSTLTLSSASDIIVNDAVQVTGNGGLVAHTDTSSDPTALYFFSSGSVHFWDLASNLTINGSNYTLVGDVATLATDVKSNPSGHFALAASYDAKHDGTYKKPPVTTPMAGVFEGLGNTISNLKVNVKKGNFTGSPWLGQSGLFAGIAAGGVIDSVGVGANVTGGDLMNVGILAAESSGMIDKSWSSGSAKEGNGLSGYQVQSPDAGGLVGAMFTGSTVINSSSTATVSGGDTAFGGGLVGGIYGGTVSASSASGNVTTGGNALGSTFEGSASGGLIGLIYTSDGPAEVTLSMASGNATVGEGGSDSGGLVGAGAGTATISYSFATGSATTGAGNQTEGYGYAGGFGGFLFPYNNATLTIDQSYASGASTGSPYTLVGGFVGYANATITNAYSTGSASATGSGPTAIGGFAGLLDTGGSIADSYSTGFVEPVAGSYLGGFVGDLAGTLTATYWDTDTSGIANLSQGAGNESNAPGVTGLSTVQLQARLPNGFQKSIWKQQSGFNNGLPFLKALPPEDASKAQRTAAQNGCRLGPCQPMSGRPTLHHSGQAPLQR